MNYDQLKLDNQLCFPFYAVSRLITRTYQADLDELGITYTQYLVLMVLWETNGVSVNDIAEKLILNTNTITPLLKRMESMQLLKRLPSENDKRKVIVSLSEKAIAMQEIAAQIPEKMMRKLMPEPTDSQINDFLALKNTLNDVINVLKQLEN
jgi:DNA-binding MarR family transcriptional regulator